LLFCVSNASFVNQDCYQRLLEVKQINKNGQSECFYFIAKRTDMVQQTVVSTTIALIKSIFKVPKLLLILIFKHFQYTFLMITAYFSAIIDLAEFLLYLYINEYA